MKKLNLKREQLKLDVAESINRLSLEGLVDIDDNTIAELMVDSFVALVKARIGATNFNGTTKPSYSAVCFVENIEEK